MAKQRNNQSRRGRLTGRNRHISIRSARRTEPDLKKIAQAVVSLALAQAEAEAQSHAKAAQEKAPVPPSDTQDGHPGTTEAGHV